MGKKKKSREYSSESEASSDSDEIEKRKKHKKSSKKHKKHKSKKKRKHSSSDPESQQDEWCEKNADEKPPKSPQAPVQRDDWMSAEGFMLPTFSKERKETKTVAEKSAHVEYDPATSSRELNPYFKTGEGGMPSFQRPKDDDDDYFNSRGAFHRSSTQRSSTSGGWRKSQRDEPEVVRRRESPPRRSESPPPRQLLPAKPPETQPEPEMSAEASDFLTDQQMNEIGARMIKAELMGNAKLAAKLKDKLDRAKAFKSTVGTRPKARTEKESVVLSVPTPSGMSRPVRENDERTRRKDDPKKKKVKRVETHMDGERMSYYPDDDKYDIKQMFEREKFVDGKDQDIEFAKAFSKVKAHDQMDMADIFSDNIRKDKQKKTDDRDDAIREHQRMEKVLDSCFKCFDSPKMSKDLVVFVGKKIYLSIPYYEGLVRHHLIISPIQHVSCSTMADEDMMEELTNMKKALNQFFFKEKEDVVFFETVKYLNRRPHMEIHCVSSPDLEMIEFYFKKAIQESEKGTLNKKLVELKNNKNIRQAVPRGLPYFHVDFGNSGMAHVIEDQETFPSNFAQEIIGGMLNLDVNRWRKPRKEQNPKRRVDYFNSKLKSVLKSL